MEDCAQERPTASPERPTARPERPTHILLGGGGLAGMSYVGVMEGLQLFGYMAHVHTVTGISAGALAGAALVCGTPAVVVRRFFADFIDDARLAIPMTSFLAFPQTLGVYDATPSMDIVAACLRYRWPHLDPAAITLADFWRLTKIKFNVLVTDLAACAPVTLNAETFPDVPVLVALRAGSAVPLIMPPVVWRGHCWVDGWVTADNPFVAHKDAPIPPAEALYLSLGAASTCASPTASMGTYLQAVFNAFMRNKSEGVYPMFCHHRIHIADPVAPFFPVTWNRRAARIAITHKHLHDAFLQGLDVFLEWHSTSSAP